MVQNVNKIETDGTITKIALFENMKSPRYNLQSFIMEEVWNNHNLWDESARKKADALIKEGRGYYMYEDESGVVYTIRKNPVLETALKVCKLLESYGVRCTLDERIDLPEKILRGSWYVEKLVELGIEECMHIDLKGSLGFIAILDGGRIMSGNNIMVMDAFSSLGMEFGLEDDSVTTAIFSDGWEVYSPEECEEDVCIICNSYDLFEKFVKSANSDIAKALSHIRRNVDMNEVGLAIRKMDEQRESLVRVNHALCDAIYDLMEEYGQDNDLPEGWWLDEYDEEEILFRL